MTEKLEYSAADMASAAAGGWRDGQRAAAEAARAAPDEVFAIPVRENGKRTTIYTEVLPFVPGPGVEVLGEPVRMVAAQSGPAGEREAFTQADVTHEMLDAFKVSVNAHDRMGVNYDERTRIAIAAAMSAQQRTQASGVPDALREAVEYLDDNRFNRIEAGSILHRAMRDALAAAPAQPAVRAEENYSTTSDRYRAELYDEVWQKARDMGYGNVTMALEELAAFRANAPAQPEVQRLREALEYFVSVMPKHGWPTDYDGWRRVEIAADKSRIALATSTGQEVE